MTESTGTFTTTDGTALFTRSWPIDEPRYDMLIVHGLGEHSGRWDAPAKYFNDHGAFVSSYDLRGHGRSGGVQLDLEDFDLFLSDIAEMATATAASSGRPWVLYGHSLGGLQVAGYVIDERQPEPNLAVLSAPAMAALRGIDTVLKGAAKVLGSIAPSMRVSSNIKGEMLSRDPAVGEAYFADEFVHTSPTTRFGKAVFAEQDRLAGRHGEITIQSLVIHGADDTLVQPAASAALAASGAVERKLYPGLRHEMHNEPEATQVLGDVADWIDRKLFG